MERRSYFVVSSPMPCDSWFTWCRRQALCRVTQCFELFLEFIPITGFDADEMGFFAPLQARDAFSRGRSKHDYMGHSFRRPRPMQRLDDRRHVIAVDVAHFPAEGTPFFRDGFHPQNNGTIGLN